MRLIPDPDEVRETALSKAVRSAIGTPIRFLDDGPDLATWIVSWIWHERTDEVGNSMVRPFAVAMAVATDAFRAARASLHIHELSSVFVDLRRVEEMHTLAVAMGSSPGEARRWLDDSAQVQQARLRKLVEKQSAELAASMQTLHGMLSETAHGRAQTLAVYENVKGRFDWPPHADSIDPARIRAVYVTVCAVLGSHFRVFKWLLGDWAVMGELGEPTSVYLEALTNFVLAHQDHGDWQAIAPGHAAEWLGIDLDFPMSREHQT